MARQARGEYLNPDEIQVVHAVQKSENRDTLFWPSFSFRPDANFLQY